MGLFDEKGIGLKLKFSIETFGYCFVAFSLAVK